MDHLTLFGLVPPGQILFGSDMPYGTRSSRRSPESGPHQSGLSPDQVPMISWPPRSRILDGDSPVWRRAADVRLDCEAGSSYGMSLPKRI